MKKPIITVKNVTHNYTISQDEFINALDSISLTINEGEFIAVVGHNGSGKSTLAKILNGLILPTAGDIYVFEKNTKDKEHQFTIRSNVGVVFQNPETQMVASIVEDDIAFGPENLGISRKDIEERINWSLASVGMLEYKKATPFKMSGGQKQRIAIAGILAMKPKVLILDESTAMLDPIGRKEVMSVIKNLNKNEQMTVILVTHYMDEVIDADRIIVMNKGQIVMDNVPDEIFKNSEYLESIGLSLPYISQIANQLNKAGLNVRKNTTHLDELVEQLCQ